MKVVLDPDQRAVVMAVYLEEHQHDNGTLPEHKQSLMQWYESACVVIEDFERAGLGVYLPQPRNDAQEPTQRAMTHVYRMAQLQEMLDWAVPYREHPRVKRVLDYWWTNETSITATLHNLHVVRKIIETGRLHNGEPAE